MRGPFKSIQGTSEAAVQIGGPSVYVSSDLCHPGSRQDMAKGAFLGKEGGGGGTQ